MKFVYFTKLLKGQDLDGLVGFCKDTGLDGFDLAVRPGYPVHPDNVAAELPKAARQFKDAGLIIGANVVATNNLVASTSANKGAYKNAMRAYRDRLQNAGLITGGQASALSTCINAG